AAGNLLASSPMESRFARHPGSARPADNGHAAFHARTYSNSSLPHEQSPPYSPRFRSNTSGPELRQASGTPPGIRQTRTELQPARRGTHGGSSGGGSNSSAASYASSKDGHTQQQQQDEAAKNNYALWLPWEETALVDWLYEPANCKLFNVPRRKKECHERIIQEILPSKTSRAIEGKIRTIEKRYQKAAQEIQRADFAAKHPGKRAEEVAEALCNNFHKLESVFNPAQAQARSQLHEPKKWLGAAETADHAPATAASAASAAAGSGSTVSVPRSSPPPRISMAESLPLPHRSVVPGRKIAPKRGGDGDDDAPVMMSHSKRSRTLPSILQNRRSPGRQLTPQQHPQHPHHHHQQQQHRQRSPLPLQQFTMQQAQQQQRLFENGRFVLDMSGRPSTALPMMQVPSPMASLAAQQQQAQQQHRHQAAGTQTGAGEDIVQGTREDLEWLQLNLRREELEFRKTMFEHDQELEGKRVRLEEHRLENQRREMDLESKRLDVQRRQLDMQIESLQSLTSMLGQMVSQMGSMLHPDSDRQQN
ncbi:hypothetical protein LPJ70_002364, partial [Coemansia sp. RSA 2708]